MARKKIVILWFVIGIMALSSLGAYLYLSPVLDEQLTEEKNPYLSFVDEAYTTIQDNYWNEITDEQLSNLFELAVEKVSEGEIDFQLSEKNLTGVEELITMNIVTMSDSEGPKKFVASVVDVVLANLEPFGRSRLFTEQQEQDLRNAVENVNPEKDLYATLNLPKDATEEQIEEAYEEKIETATEEEKGEIEHAKEVLTDDTKKQRYDTTGAEPTTSARLISPQVAYMEIERFSPVTFDEFQKDAQRLDQGDELDSLIIDLRNNIGGAIDLLPYFLGPFIGPDQYAYEFFHKGEKIPFKTKVGWLDSLVRYKKVVVLINENTQSSAEVMAATLKKYNVGVVVGKTTRGHGTIERIIPMETQISDTEKFSIFLVENLTLRDDGQPIEDKGVQPTIDMSSDSWKAQLNSYFNYEPLIKAVEELWNQD
jgi:C-terminal processing protease CtpA/Prc